jgi:hypothetical protein
VGANATGLPPGGNTVNGPVSVPRIHTCAIARSPSAAISITSNLNPENAVRSHALVVMSPGTPGRTQAAGSPAAAIGGLLLRPPGG